MDSRAAYENMREKQPGRQAARRKETEKAKTKPWHW